MTIFSKSGLSSGSLRPRHILAASGSVFPKTKMAAKSSRPGRLETEIEKYRGDGNWSRVLDLSRQLSAKTPHLGSCLNIFVLPCCRNVNMPASRRIV